MNKKIEKFFKINDLKNKNQEKGNFYTFLLVKDGIQILKNKCNMFSFEIYSLTTKRKDGKKVIGNWNNSIVSISI